MSHVDPRERRLYLRSWRRKNPERIAAYKARSLAKGIDPERTREIPRVRRRRTDARLSAEQVVAAWTLYSQGGLSLREIAEKLWRQYDYSSRESCTVALRRAFVKRGGWKLRGRYEKRWAPRRCRGKKTSSPRLGQKCRRWAKVGSDYCPDHEQVDGTGKATVSMEKR